jgi:protein ImuB
MAPRGCISVDSLPLQILLKDHPSWAATPVAVTREERPQSPILALNRAARAKGLTPGMKYASALSLVPDLRAREVPPDRIRRARDLIVRILFSFTPDIEPCPFDPDAFWVSVEGLRSVFPSESRWIEIVRGALAAEGFQARVVTGFTRFGTYAIARSQPSSWAAATRAEERALVGRSSIDILPLSTRQKGLLFKLEVRTVQQFVTLPEQQIVRRFGKEAGLLRRLILSDDPLPIPSAAVTEREACRRHFDSPVADAGLLLPHIDELLAIEARRAEAERSVISGLALILRTEDGEITTDLIRPAAPTLKTQVLRRLVELRLSARQFSSGVEDVEIRSARTRPSRTQGELFTVRRRDLEAGARAFAAIRARFGNGAVTSARLHDSHLPERSFSWVQMERPILPAPSGHLPSGHLPAADRCQGLSDLPAAVRRIFFEPKRAPAGQRAPARTVGPFTVSGSWWGSPGKDSAYLRDYYFASSPEGIAWLYEDRLDGSSWIQGTVD